MNYHRDSGILLPVFSLPGPNGIGDFGSVAREWVDRLAESGQTLWQILPLGPTGYGDSPYASTSAFGLNPLLISLAELAEEGWITGEELASARLPDSSSIQYSRVMARKMPLIRVAARRFLENASVSQVQAFTAFCEREQEWLGDFAVFSSLKSFYNEAPWWEWKAPHRDAGADAVAEWKRIQKPAIDAVRVIQFFAASQWDALRRHASQRGVRVIGDMPIFVAHDSADVWGDRELFQLNSNGSCRLIAGVPPDYFSSTGQRWGNPIYAWEAHRKTGFSWWLKRFRQMFAQLDIVRVDHFRGFSACWEIPGDQATAEGGTWVDAPGFELFEALLNEHPGERLPVIAEDLGVITDEVLRLRDTFHFPGIRILQFAFGTDPMKDTFIPGAYDETCIAYTGTHDNDTVAGWFNSQPGVGSARDEATIESERQAALDYFGTEGTKIHRDFIAAILASNAAAAIIPLQDLLGLGSEARLNTPGVPSGNWCWRLASTGGLADPFAWLATESKKSRRGRFGNRRASQDSLNEPVSSVHPATA